LTGAIAIPDFSLIVPSQAIAPNLSWFASAREWGAYDLLEDAYLVRHDILGVDTQLGVSHKIYRERFAEQIAEARDISAALFAKEMRRRGMSLESLRPLPPPPGYVEPDWLRI
jgi:hypothetical protein